jgi:1,3-propanediol dehydrogenase
MKYPEFSVTVPVVFGCGAIRALGERVRDLGCKKALCVYDEGTLAAGIVEKARRSLVDAGIGTAGFGDVQSDPLDSIVDAAAAAAKAAGADCFVGIGGGSSMDTAKAAAIAFEKSVSAKDFVLAEPIMIGISTPVILVPTTAGTGSEVTTVAIISRPDMSAKWSVFTNTSLAIVDPELTLTLPKGQTANTGLDALSHAAEAMTTVNRNAHSDLFGEAAIRKIFKNLRVCYDEPDDIGARTEMMLAANWAGFAFNNPVAHVGHAAADALSCAFHTPHGYNCALALPEALKLAAPALPEQARRIADAMGIAPEGPVDGAELGALIAEAVRALMRDLKVKPLRELGIARPDVTALAHDVVTNHLSAFCPVEITDAVAKTLLGDLYDNY